MKKFIRLDTVGEWRGTEHVSSVGVSSFVPGHESFEKGVSCYRLDNQAEALKSLFDYWTGIVMLDNADDYNDMQITIFEGELIGEGSDYEDIATCERTLAEIDAKPIMKVALEAYFEEKYGDMDEEELDEILNGIELI